jgi:hypothetical protein
MLDMPVNTWVAMPELGAMGSVKSSGLMGVKDMRCRKGMKDLSYESRYQAMKQVVAPK